MKDSIVQDGLLCHITFIYNLFSGEDRKKYKDEMNIDDTKAEKNSKPLPWSCKLLWILHTIAFDANLVVCVTFWTLLYPYFRGVRPLWGELCRHGMGLLYIYIESFFIAFPFRLLHTIYSAIFMLGYLIFTLLLFSIGAPPPYPILDWKGDPAMSLTYSVLIGVATLFAHLINFTGCWLVSSARTRSQPEPNLMEGKLVEADTKSAVPLEVTTDATKTDSSLHTPL